MWINVLHEDIYGSFKLLISQNIKSQRALLFDQYPRLLHSVEFEDLIIWDFKRNIPLSIFDDFQPVDIYEQVIRDRKFAGFYDACLENIKDKIFEKLYGLVLGENRITIPQPLTRNHLTFFKSFLEYLTQNDLIINRDNPTNIIVINLAFEYANDYAIPNRQNRFRDFYNKVEFLYHGFHPRKGGSIDMKAMCFFIIPAKILRFSYRPVKNSPENSQYKLVDPLLGLEFTLHFNHQCLQNISLSYDVINPLDEETLKALQNQSFFLEFEQ